jgi:polar amino acid transport system substrate-binding protein
MAIFSLSKYLNGFIRILIFGMFISIIILSQAQQNHTIFAQESKVNSVKKLKIATKIAAPMVMEKDLDLQGFSIELWQEIAKRNNFETQFVMKNNVKEMLDSVINYQTDAAIAAISQTPERERIIDFSQPYLNAGLEILVRANESSLIDQLIIFFRSDAMKLLYFGLFAIFILAHFHHLYRILRKINIKQNYFYNIWDSIWWLFNGFFRTEFGDQKDRFHQIISAILIIVSIIFITQFQASVTADLTLDKIDSKITSLEDIKNKKVGVVSNTTAHKFVTDNKIKFETFESNDNLQNALISSKVDVIILDAPIAKYYATQDGKGKVVESITLNREHYSIAFPIGSALRKQVNATILDIEQDGTMAILNKKWFGIQ